MLKKLETQNSHEKIWYCDADWDLIIWINPDNSPRGFQICYDKDDDEKALTFTHGEFSHGAVDSGTDDLFANRSPTVEEGLVFDTRAFLKIFETKAEYLEKIYFDYIKEHLNQG